MAKKQDGETRDSLRRLYKAAMLSIAPAPPVPLMTLTWTLEAARRGNGSVSLVGGGHVAAPDGTHPGLLHAAGSWRWRRRSPWR